MKPSKAATAICVMTLAPLALSNAQDSTANTEADQAQVQDVQVLYQDAQRRLENAARDVTELSYRRIAPLSNRLVNTYNAGRSNGPFLGIATVDDDNGVRVASVTPNGPAFEAGIESGDIIVEIGDASLAPTADVRPTQRLVSQLALVDTGDDVELTVSRDGETIGFVVDTAETWSWNRTYSYALGGDDSSILVRRAGDGPLVLGGVELGEWNWNWIFSGDRWAGMELIALSPELGAYFGTEQGLLVVSSPNDETLGLADGDVILDIGGRVPSSPEHAMRILASFAPTETVRLDIMRQQTPQTLEVTLTDAPMFQ